MDITNGKPISYATQAVKNEEWSSGILKATKNGLRRQLHLSPHKLSSDIEVICIPYILLTVTAVLCITREPNGKLSGNFVWLDMGLPNTEKELNTLNASVFTKFESLLSGYLRSFVLNSAQFSFEMLVLNSCWWRNNMQKACCPFYASLLFENNLKKGVWSWTLWIEIYLVAYSLWHEVCCLFAPMQWNRKVSFCHWQ